MRVRHPSCTRARPPFASPRAAALPTLWLMTDERQGEALWSAIRALLRGSGIVFRHFATPDPARAAILARVDRMARRYGLVLVEAGAARQPIRILPAHSVREGLAARRAGADLILVSPVYATRTHPGARPLGPVRAAVIARTARIPAIALGGMDRARFGQLQKLGFVGWAAIDGLTSAKPNRGQKRKAVPI